MEGGNMMHEEDPFESIRISTSQQELLNTVPFVGDTLTSPCNCNCNCNCNNFHHDADADAEIIPPASSTPPVILLSAPDTQHVYDPPLPSSVIQCQFNQAIIDVDDVSQIFVHFPGFQNDSEFLEQDRLTEFQAISDFDKAPVKLGLDEFRNFENEISCFFEENDAADVNMVDVEGNKSSLDLMPDSIRSSFEKDKEKETVTVFDVLKFLAETAVKEDDGLTLLETIKRAGVIFPRPSWWPDDMKSELFNLR